MSILDTFYLLFKTDAKGAAGEVEALGKQIDALKAKGKSRSDQENKDLKEAIARQKELKDNIAETNRQTEKLVDSAASLAAAYVGFSAIKNGIVNTAELNRNLSVQSKNLGIVTNDLRAYSAAVKQFGGSDTGFQQFIAGKTLDANSRGLPFDFKEYVRGVREFIKNMDDAGKRAVLTGQGIAPENFGLFTASDEDFNRQIDAMYDLARATESADKAAKEYGDSTRRLDDAMTAFWSTVGGDVLPGMTRFNNVLADFFSDVAKDGEAAIGVFTAMAAAASALAIQAAKLSGVLPALSTAFAAIKGVGAAGLVAVQGATAWQIGAGAAAAYDPSVRDESWIGRATRKVSGWLDSDVKMMNEARLKGGSLTGGGLEFWMRQGYTREQAAVIESTIQHESAGNPAARGDGGLAHGLVQWHPARRAAILAGTGIDVSNASADQQRQALAWEMKNIKRSGWSDDTFRGMSDINQLSSYYTGKYISPADTAGQSLLRAQTALGLASGYQPGDVGGAGGGRSMSVKIDEVNVNTAATDAAGIAAGVSDELDRHLRTLAANIDDGEAY